MKIKCKVIDIRFNAQNFYIFSVVVENVYDNDEKLKNKFYQRVININGDSLDIIQSNSILEVEGEMASHSKYGEYLKASNIEVILSNHTKESLHELFANSFKSIDKHLATRIIDHFTVENVLSILTDNIDKVKEVPGIGDKRLVNIKKEWGVVLQNREAKNKLIGLGLDTKQVIRLIEYAKLDFNESLNRAPTTILSLEEEIKVINILFESIKDDPYELYYMLNVDIRICDKIAAKRGMALDDPKRVRAIIDFILLQNELKGHCLISISNLINEVVNEYGITKNVYESLQLAKEKESIVMYDTCIYRKQTHDSEVYIAEDIINRVEHTRLPFPVPVLEKDNTFSLSDEQKAAAEDILNGGVHILTGRAGAGKSSTVKAVVDSLQNANMQYSLIAPTGRAAQRLYETTGSYSCTIHSFLQWAGPRFVYNENNKRCEHYVIVDEASMVDINLFAALLKALPGDCSLLIIGDTDQLMSVGPGKVLFDLINSGTIKVHQLTKVFRQAANSTIIQIANSIKDGNTIDRSDIPKDVEDVILIEASDDADIAYKMRKIVTKLVVDMGYDPEKDVQILSPMRNTDSGVINLNSLSQQLLNGESTVRHAHFAVNDKVMNIKNNSKTGIMNGEIGFITSILKNKLMVRFDDAITEVDSEGNAVKQFRLAEYSGDTIGNLIHSYACTIHKSQGSEFPVVIIPLSMSHRKMLQRNLFYTAVTRGKKVVILVGKLEALNEAILNPVLEKRNTFLLERLTGKF